MAFGSGALVLQHLGPPSDGLPARRDAAFPLEPHAPETGSDAWPATATAKHQDVAGLPPSDPVPDAWSAERSQVLSAAGVAHRPAPAAADRLPRVTVREPANLRTGPDGQANVIRVVPRGETLRAHNRTANGWVQVGDAEPRGWLHTSRLGEIE